MDAMPVCNGLRNQCRMHDVPRSSAVDPAILSMAMNRHSSTTALVIAILASGCQSGLTYRAGETLVGDVGGSHAKLSLTAAGGTIQYDCAHGGVWHQTRLVHLHCSVAQRHNCSGACEGIVLCRANSTHALRLCIVRHATTGPGIRCDGYSCRAGRPEPRHRHGTLRQRGDDLDRRRHHSPGTRYARVRPRCLSAADCRWRCVGLRDRLPARRQRR